MELFAPAPYRHGNEEAKPEPIMAIYYYEEEGKWIPHSVITQSRTYDFTLCVGGELVYHNSGSGNYDGKIDLYQHEGKDLVCKIWYDHKQASLTHNKQPLADTEAGQLGYQIIPFPLGGNPFEMDNAQEDEAGIVYCTQCKGYHPESSICHHVKHEDGNGLTLGCGAAEVNFSETQVSLYRLLRLLSPEAVEILKKNLSSPDFHAQFSDSMLGGDCNLNFSPQWLDIYCESLGEQRNYEERFWPGIAWLHSLDANCKDALALTLGWIWMFQEQGWATAPLVPKHDYIHHLSRKELQKWLEIDPQDFNILRNKPLRVKLNFKAECANDHLFQKNPESCNEVRLWPKDGTIDISLVLSVAEVKRINKNTVDLYFGSIIERNNKHLSEIEDYRIETHSTVHENLNTKATK
jgi:hypothetical protein